MKTHTTTIEGTANANLHVRITKPLGSAKAVLHILHGMAEYAARYDAFAQHLANEGIIVVAHDHRGHGLSVKEERVGILDKSDTFNAILADVDCVMQSIRKDYETLPYFFLGHSMGSVILRRYLQKYPAYVDKAIIMGSPPRYPFLFVKVMRFIATFSGFFIAANKRRTSFAAMLNKGFLKDYETIRTPFDWLSTNEKNVDKYIEDPLCGYPYNKRFYRQFFKLIDETNKRKAIRMTKAIPMLFISGVDDPLADNMKAVEKLESLYRNLAKAQTKVIKIEDARHEVLNETDPSPTYQAILEFLGGDA